MIHGSKKIKFHSGKDSNRMILRKMLVNFFINSHIETTLKRGKILKTAVDNLMSKVKENSSSSKNVVLSTLQDVKLVKYLFNKIRTQVENINGGFVRLVKIGQRENDGSPMVRLEWAHPVVSDYKSEISKKDSKPMKKIAKEEVKKTISSKDKVKKSKDK